MIFTFDKTRNHPGTQAENAGGMAAIATLNPLGHAPALTGTPAGAAAAETEADRKQAFETSLAIVFLRNSWFFSNLIDKSLPQIRDLVVPVLRKVFLSRKYGKCFAEPSAAELALFNCFCTGEEVRTSYHAYQSTIATGYPQPGMAAVPRTADEIQGFVDYYSGYVFAKIGDKKAFDEQWMAIRHFGQFLKDPSRFSAKRLTLEDIGFIDPGTATLVRDALREGGQAGGDTGARDLAAPKAACRAPAQEEGAAVIAFSSGQVRRERATLAATAQKWPGETTQPRKKSFALRSAARENTYRAERRGLRCERSEDALLVSRVFGGLIDDTDLQKISALSFSRTRMVGGETFHDTAMAARKFGAPYTPGDYGSAIPEHWFDTLPELNMLKEKFPELI